MEANNKLRDTLVTIRKRLVAPYESESQFMRLSHDKPLVDLIDAALAAPPRNCDIAQDWLRDLYVNFKPPASVREMPPEWVDAVMAFCRWLVAPATEKEGGEK